MVWNQKECGLERRGFGISHSERKYIFSNLMKTVTNLSKIPPPPPPLHPLKGTGWGQSRRWWVKGRVLRGRVKGGGSGEGGRREVGDTIKKSPEIMILEPEQLLCWVTPFPPLNPSGEVGGVGWSVEICFDRTELVK